MNQFRTHAIAAVLCSALPNVVLSANVVKPWILPLASSSIIGQVKRHVEHAADGKSIAAGSSLIATLVQMSELSGPHESLSNMLAIDSNLRALLEGAPSSEALRRLSLVDPAPMIAAIDARAVEVIGDLHADTMNSQETLIALFQLKPFTEISPKTRALMLEARRLGLNTHMASIVRALGGVPMPEAAGPDSQYVDELLLTVGQSNDLEARQVALDTLEHLSEQPHFYRPIVDGLTKTLTQAKATDEIGPRLVLSLHRVIPEADEQRQITALTAFIKQTDIGPSLSSANNLAYYSKSPSVKRAALDLLTEKSKNLGQDSRVAIYQRAGPLIVSLRRLEGQPVPDPRGPVWGAAARTAAITATMLGAVALFAPYKELVIIAAVFFALVCLLGILPAVLWYQNKRVVDEIDSQARAVASL